MMIAATAVTPTTAIVAPGASALPQTQAELSARIAAAVHRTRVADWVGFIGGLIVTEFVWAVGRAAYNSYRDAQLLKRGIMPSRARSR